MGRLLVRPLPSPYWYLERAEYPLGTTPTVRLFATLERRDAFRPLIVVRVFWRVYGPIAFNSPGFMALCRSLFSNRLNTNSLRRSGSS